MSTHARALAFSVVLIALLSSTATVQDKPAPSTEIQKLSYALGMDLGKQVRR